MLVAAGTPPDEAETVMRGSIDANLAGHDSHGIIQIPTYIDRIQAGHIVPGAPWTIVQESPIIERIRFTLNTVALGLVDVMAGGWIGRGMTWRIRRGRRIWMCDRTRCASCLREYLGARL